MPDAGGPAFDIDFRTAPLPGAALHAVLAQARAAGGFAHVRMHGRPALLLTRFADLRAFFLDHDTFPGGATYQFEIRPVVGNTFINMDGVEHNRYRQLAMPAFRSAAASRFAETELVPLAHEIIDRFAARGAADLVAELTGVLPFWAISRKLGLPMGSEETQRQWAHAMLSYPVDPDGALAAAQAVTRFLEPALAERRQTPRGDVLSHLLAAEHSGLRLSDEEIVSHVRLLYAVGATTTSDAMSSLLWRLLSEPGVYERARDDATVRPRLVDEVLRLEPPVAVLPRLVTQGGNLGAMTVPAGSVVLAGIAAANRDPAVFDDPDRLDLDRREGEIMTFGFGVKFCPGAYLARAQLGIALAAVLERLPDLRLVEPADPTGGILRSVKRLIVRWQPR
jgi:cytochrome P450